jgi:DNA-binding HxlR family transcriptional regulator
MTDKDPCFDSSYQCPIQFIVGLLGNKWSILVLKELFQGSRRTHQLLQALPGISTKTLTVRLRELESHGLVQRDVYPEIPPRVEYYLTDKGKEIKPVLTAMYNLGSQWLDQPSCDCAIEMETLT